MKGIKQHVAKFNPIRSFRNLCIAGAVAASTTPVFAATIIDTSEIATTFSDGKADMSTVGGYVAGGLVVLAVAALIFGMLRKA
ncbi:major capsid protein [Pseudomonas sp. JH-2]|uniref:major capsid protein n=1 Tax=Pseudomonas sp. JH-2 TaxID=3114998 RepID=UPI002E2645A4|nr:major capsid protein [Pseudomonas sp. JH-2]